MRNAAFSFFVCLLGAGCTERAGAGEHDASTTLFADAALAPDAGPGDRDAGPPITAEACDGRDDDRDTAVDEGCPCAGGDSQACYGGDPAHAGVGACALGAQSCETSFEFPAWGACEGWVAPADESCGGGDEDCDGSVDEGCDPEGCTPSPETCRDGADEDCDDRIDEGCEDGPVVGRAVVVGAGRLLVWGDEHVASDSYGEAPKPFWHNALAWLSCSGCATGARTRVGLLGLRMSSAMESEALALGLVVRSVSGASASELAGLDVLLVNSFSPIPGTPELRAWVEGGGALMTLAIGIGAAEECDALNAILTPFPLRYDCREPAPWGPVTELLPHPVTAGLASEATPFVNGRYVAEDADTGSTVLARVSR